MPRFAVFEAFYRSRAAGKGWTPSVVAWAEDRLLAGEDTTNLRILAGLSPGAPRAEVEEYWALALRDLGLDPIGEIEQCLGEARAVAGAFLDGELDARSCASRVHDLAVGPLNHPKSLQPWCDLDGGFVTVADEKVEQLEGAELDAAIERYASDFVAADPDAQLERLLDETRGRS